MNLIKQMAMGTALLLAVEQAYAGSDSSSDRNRYLPTTVKSAKELRSVCEGGIGCGFINSKGNYVIPPVFEGVRDFSKDDPVLALAKKNGKWGFIDLKGVFVIEPIYDHGDSTTNGFSSGYALVAKKIETGLKTGQGGIAKKGTWGIINSDGHTVVPLQYDDLRIFDYLQQFPRSGMFVARLNNKYGCVSIKTGVVVGVEYEDASCPSENGLSRVKQGGKWGYVDTHGQYVVNPEFEEARPFNSDGLASVNQDGKWGIIDAKGQFVLPPSFDDLQLFYSDSYALAKLGGYWGYINSKGTFIIEPRFEDAQGFVRRFNFKETVSNLAPVRIDGKWGYINKAGRIVIPPQFTFADQFDEFNLAMVMVGKKVGVIDMGGNYVIQPEYDRVRPFSPSGIAVVTKDNKHGYVDVQGKALLPTKFNSAYDFSENGVADVVLDGKRLLIDTKGNTVLHFDVEKESGIRIAKNRANKIVWPEKKVIDAAIAAKRKLLADCKTKKILNEDCDRR